MRATMQSCNPRTLLHTILLASSVISTSIPDSVDVAVVGAGLSGLTAARNLLRAGKSVVVLEGRDRVGGKVYNHPLKNGGVTEVGAEFVGPTQDKVLGLISELGLGTFSTYSEGKNVLWRNSTRLAYTADPRLGGAPPVDTSDFMQIASTQTQLNEWAASLNTSEPWKHPRAAEWDSKTFEQYLEEAAPSSDANFVLTSAGKAIFAAEPRELSLLYVLAYIAAAGNETTVGDLNRLIAVAGGAQESRVVGGTGLIPQRLAERVGKEHIVFNAAVKSITETDKGYVVASCAGNVHAKQVVVAMAPPLANLIKFSPELPANRQALNRGMKLPNIGKGVAVYQKPFWRAQEQLNAQVVSDRGAVKVAFDSTPEDASFGAILGFILGDEMRALDKLNPTRAQQLIVSDYVRYYGESATNVTEFILYRWDLEEFSRGGPVAVAPPDFLSRYGEALRAPVNGIHFAGTETSEYWTGYMDGAIRSGERVAKEILASRA